MTERLSDLLRDEADRLRTTAPPTAAVIERGRGLRRRRRLLEGLVAVVAVVAVASTAWALAGSGGDTRAVDPAGGTDRTTGASPAGAVFSIGPRVYLDDGRVSAAIDDVTVKSLYYTSAGVLVRHGRNNYSDGGGPQRFSLVAPDGTVTPVGVTTEETVHATDPDEPYVAYAQTVGGEVHVLVHDVRTDEQVADVPVPGASPDYSPLSLDGDLVHLGSEDDVYVVDWRTGAVDVADVPSGANVHGGHAVVARDGSSAVVDAATGEVLVPAPARTSPDEYGYFSLSPDGAHAIYDPQTDSGPRGFEVYDVASGEHVTIPGAPYDFGWTTGGDLFDLSRDGVLTLCSAADGSCTARSLDLPVRPGTAEDFSDNLQLGGRAYES